MFCQCGKRQNLDRGGNGELWSRTQTTMYAVRIEASGFNDGHSRRPFPPSPSAYPDDSDFAQEIVDAFAATDANFGWLYLVVNDAAYAPIGDLKFVAEEDRGRSEGVSR
ncbi:hypothetical protein K466DRAFT_599178 [Polyporus arcularius HHB13444]|uniref:Uncharacterized protein n=1 Tax=Polyporus arcularius HHB13444 TaxID=1314778 RepID=A0A5C3PDI0_9APHY|nr:hypothetical protein K466DRAFT_599178 [Polyporus arcularius HHB13444]